MRKNKLHMGIIQWDSMLILLVSRAKNSNFEHRSPLYMFPVSLVSIIKFSNLEPQRKAPAIFESRFNGETSSGPENPRTEVNSLCKVGVKTNHSQRTKSGPAVHFCE